MPEEGRLRDDSRGLGRVLALVTRCTALPTHPGVGPGLVLTQTGTEKKEKAMAALALLFPKRKCLDFECCHWLARKQKATNQTPAQRTGGVRKEETWKSMLEQGQGVLGRGGLESPGTHPGANPNLHKPVSGVDSHI